MSCRAWGAIFSWGSWSSRTSLLKRPKSVLHNISTNIKDFREIFSGSDRTTEYSSIQNITTVLYTVCVTVVFQLTMVPGGPSLPWGPSLPVRPCGWWETSDHILYMIRFCYFSHVRCVTRGPGGPSRPAGPGVPGTPYRNTSQILSVYKTWSVKRKSKWRCGPYLRSWRARLTFLPRLTWGPLNTKKQGSVFKMFQHKHNMKLKYIISLFKFRTLRLFSKTQMIWQKLLKQLSVLSVRCVNVGNYLRASDGASAGPRGSGGALSTWNSSITYWTNRSLQHTHK